MRKQIVEFAKQVTLFCIQNDIENDGIVYTDNIYQKPIGVRVSIRRNNRTDEDIEMIMRRLKVMLIYNFPSIPEDRFKLYYRIADEIKVFNKQIVKRSENMRLKRLSMYVLDKSSKDKLADFIKSRFDVRQLNIEESDVLSDSEYAELIDENVDLALLEKHFLNDSIADCDVVIGGWYRHFKGKKVKVIGLAKHSENPNQKFVVYDCGQNGIFARPYDMFVSKVDKVKYPNVEQEYRFERCYENNEAFHIMKYKCSKCGHEELIWNSRDGVTPLQTSCTQDGCDGIMTHIDWELDRMCTDYIPTKGSYIWVDCDMPTAYLIAKNNYKMLADHKDEYLAKYPDAIFPTEEQFIPDLVSDMISKPVKVRIN